MRVLLLASVAIVALATGCASSPWEGPADIVATSIGQPELVGCSAYTPKQTPWAYPNRVWVEVTVLPEGRVDPPGSRAKSSRHTRGDRAAIQQAISMASTCSFKPVGEATPATIEITFD